MAGKGKKSKESKKVSKGREEVRAANKPEYVTGTGQKLWRVHLKQDCAHRICDIHNPPKGLPESDWPTHWRADRRLMERICPCGVGHPTTAHMMFSKEMDEKNGTDKAKWEGIHGCCGCCRSDVYEPYFDDTPLLLNNGASDWEMGNFFKKLFDPSKTSSNSARLEWIFSKEEFDTNAHMCPPGHCPEPEWIDHDALPNGIGPVCKDCHQLIDWHPVDHALDCPWL